MTRTNVDDIVDDYLRRLRVALAPLPVDRRQQLLTEIGEHLADARSALPDQSEAAVRGLLDRVGPPEDIAAEALADQPHAAPRRSPLLITSVVLLAVLLLGVAVGVLSHRRGSAARQSTAPTITEAQVPDVVGLSATQAGSELRSADLAVATAVRASAAVAVNVVVSQEPAAGTRVARGSVVTVTVSGGPPSSTVETTIPSTTPSSTPRATPPTTSLPPAVPDGIYVNGREGTPHYFISLTNAPGGGVSGSVALLYQDGQTSVVFTFQGTVQGGVAILRPIDIPQNGGSASQDPATVPSVISATLGSKSIGLGECTAYLHFVQSLAQCQFTFSLRGP